jgi:RHH-type transcriptional regulator, rel operon repressor / antitoxin RelB
MAVAAQNLLPCDTLNTCSSKEIFDMATSIRLAVETEQRLDYLAAQTGRTKAYYLREIIEQGIEEMEDYYLAADVRERVRKGQEPVHSAANVRAELGLDG